MPPSSKTSPHPDSERMPLPDHVDPRPFHQVPDDELMETLQQLPKTDLHCHLDGSMRIETVRDLMRDPACKRLAKRLRYRLPGTDDVEELGKLLFPGIDCKGLEEYLRAFDYTCAVLQTPEGLERAAYELALDCAAENVWYLEVRFAPMRHIHSTMDGMTVIRAVDKGLERAEKESNGKLRTAIIICAMRNFSREIGAYYRSVAETYRYARSRELAAQTSLETARLTVKARQSGLQRIVGFDLAGPEMNYPPKHHIQAFYEIVNNLLDITVHAGEAFGPASIHQAVTHLGAHRLGHGTRLLEGKGGDLLDYIKSHRIAVEVCLTSNLQTKAVESLETHPFPKLLEEEVRVSLNTDNRLISGTNMTRELFLAVKTFKLTRAAVRRLLLYGFKSAFIPYNDRRKLLLDAKSDLWKRGMLD